MKTQITKILQSKLSISDTTAAILDLIGPRCELCNGHHGAARWRVNATVEALTNNTITLWTDEFDNRLQVVKLCPEIPEWTRKVGLAFRTTIPYEIAEMDNLPDEFSAWGCFTPQPFTDLSEDELLDMIADEFDTTNL